MNHDFVFRSRRSNVMATNGMVASSQPLATLAGVDILKSGGNAADAAVAVAAALTVVEPFSTGIGGDCFALYWDAKVKKVFALNGSGPASKKANIEDILDAGYVAFPLYSGHAVSVPGTVAGWDALLRRFGSMTMGDVLSPAINYALEGYPLTEWIGAIWDSMPNKLLRKNKKENLPKHLQFTGPEQPSGEEFLVNSRPPEIGSLVKLPTLGKTLQRLRDEGKAYFYTGEFARKLCNYVQKYGGWLEPSDLSEFDVEWNDPIFADYHGVRLYECPPNGQGLAAIIAARIASEFDLRNADQNNRAHILIESMRLGFVEALSWVSDPKLQDIPINHILSDDYIKSRRGLIKMNSTQTVLKTGIQAKGGDTVYLSVIDGEGNACSFINSLYMGGGTGLVVPGTGVLLQNRAALFSLDPDHPNALRGGARPYHTIIPGMLTKDGELMASFGIMGGFMQPQAHLQILSNIVDLGYNPQQALDMPRFCLNVVEGGLGANDPGGEVYIEPEFGKDLREELRIRGHKLTELNGRERMMFGGGQIIQRNPQTGILIAGSDPRKDGCAIGY